MNSNFVKLDALDRDILSDRTKLVKYSAKAVEMLTIMDTCAKPGYVYSYYVDTGVDKIGRVLQNQGYDMITWDGLNRRPIIPKSNKPKFVVLSGKSNKEFINWSVKTYSEPSNQGGKNLAWVVGTDVLSLGVSLKGTRTEILFGPSWDWPSMNQIEGRGYRFCGSTFLPVDEQVVDVYYLIANVHRSKGDNIISIDKYMYYVADIKKEITDDADNIFHSVSIDCDLFSWANKNDVKNITCYAGPSSVSAAILPVGSTSMKTKDTKIAHSVIKFTGKRSYATNDYTKVKETVDRQKDRVSSIYVEAGDRRQAETIKKQLLKDIADISPLSAFPIKIIDSMKPNVVRVKYHKRYAMNFDDVDSGSVEADLKNPKDEKTYMKKRKGVKKIKEGLASCPVKRRPVNDTCPDVNYPYIRTNAKNVKCCYKRPPGKIRSQLKRSVKKSPVKKMIGFHITTKGLVFNNMKCDNMRKSDIIREANKQKITLDNRLTKANMCKYIATQVT